MIRSCDPALCPVRALAYHFAHRFTLGGHIFPDPADKDAWLTAAMFPGRQDPTSNITYERQAQELRELFDELGLDFSKLTHASFNRTCNFLNVCLWPFVLCAGGFLC